MIKSEARLLRCAHVKHRDIYGDRSVLYTRKIITQLPVAESQTSNHSLMLEGCMRRRLLGGGMWNVLFDGPKLFLCFFFLNADWQL